MSFLTHASGNAQVAFALGRGRVYRRDVTRILGIGVALALALGLALPASADTFKHERHVKIAKLYLGLTHRGWVGVHLEYGPKPSPAPTTISVAIGARPRVIYGFIDDQVASPIHSSAPNDSHRRAGVHYRVIVSFCWPAAKGARIAKRGCARTTTLTTHATLHHRFPAPS